MIVILKRNDLIRGAQQKSTDDLQLEHFGLPRAVLNMAELVVFMDGPSVKFLHQANGFRSQESLEVLVRLMAGRAQIEPPPVMKIKHLQIEPKKPHGNKGKKRAKKE